jgi:hypothetical protein
MFSWTVSLKQERSAGWYSIAGIVALSLIVWGFVEAIYALSIVVIIFVGVYLLIENNAPDSVEVTVDDNGIGIGSDFTTTQKSKTLPSCTTTENPCCCEFC